MCPVRFGYVLLYRALKDVMVKTKRMNVNSDSEEDSADEMDQVVVDADPKEKWDCESIISESFFNVLRINNGF